jgi:hypothetical protein
VLFDNGREGAFLPPDALFPVAEVIEAAVHIFEHGELSPQVEWVGWDTEPSAAGDLPRDRRSSEQ